MEPVTGRLKLKKGRDKPVHNRHPWLFSGAIGSVEGQPQPGDLVDVVSAGGEWLARGYYNPHSQICARLLTWDAQETIDDEFWRGRLERAVSARVMLELEPKTNAYRLANAESDGLPGLIVDRYDRFLVIQCQTLGIERRKESLVGLLADLLQPDGILERSDLKVRQKEGLPEVVGLRHGQSPPPDLVVLENGHRFKVNLWAGHKTGFYLDQRPNRSAVCHPSHVAGHEVLNVFAYTGGFAVYAAANGARLIVNVDSSPELLALAEENVALNGYGRPGDEYLAGDAFQVLRDYRDSGRTFGVIILDPPKFANSQADLERACRGYKDLNWLALRLLRPGGLLATFSCSGLVSSDLFQKVVWGAAVDAGRQGQVLHQLGQGADHPVLLNFPESAYLKGLLVRVW